MLLLATRQAKLFQAADFSDGLLGRTSYDASDTRVQQSLRMAHDLNASRLLPRVSRLVRSRVASLELAITSDVRRIPFVGKWLAPRLSRAVSGNPERATLANLLTYLSRAPPGLANLPDAVASRVGLLCQNRRANLCVRSATQPEREYHVRDINKGCAMSLPMTLLVLARRRPDLVPNPRVLQGLRKAVALVANRDSTLIGGRLRSAAAECPCKSTAAQCNAQHGLCEWITVPGQRQCVPRVADVDGFEGILPFSGQETETSSVSHERGTYGPTQHGYQWRRPGAVAQISASAQNVAWAIPGARGPSPLPRPGEHLSEVERASIQRAVRAYEHQPNEQTHHRLVAARVVREHPRLQRVPVAPGGLRLIAGGERHGQRVVHHDASRHVTRVARAARSGDSEAALKARLPSRLRTHLRTLQDQMAAAPA